MEGKTNKEANNRKLQNGWSFNINLTLFKSNATETGYSYTHQF